MFQGIASPSPVLIASSRRDIEGGGPSVDTQNRFDGVAGLDRRRLGDVLVVAYNAVTIAAFAVVDVAAILDTLRR